MDRHFLAAIVLAATACSSVRGIAADSKAARIDCLHCMPGTVVAAGAPIKLQVEWKRCSHLDHGCDPDQPPFQILVSCDAMRCEAVEVGGGYLEVTPTAAGTTSIIVRLTDRAHREERLGPIHVVEPTAIDLACYFLRPGSDQREPCTGGVAPGSDVHVTMIARAGKRTLAHPMPRDVAVDGKPILTAGEPTRGSSWECRISSDTPEPGIPEVRKCVRKRVPPGVTWTIEASMPAQKLANQLRIRVGN